MLEDVEEDYFKLDDWDASDIAPWVDTWSQEQAAKAYPNLDWTLYNTFKKRIAPVDYLCSAFLDSYPIRKDADSEAPGPEVQASIDNLFERT
ncbi:MAG: hypothetical protein IPO87_17865 [Flavobacteriales bacterium]|nr:hypothetical protein [Flavobacteriales bacterium]